MVVRTPARTDHAIQKIARIPKTSELVAEQIRRLIVSGGIAEGDLLQPTKELLQRFGVSRPVLREAFRILENENLITVTRGSRTGVRVHKPSVETAARFAALTLQASGATLGELYQARLAIEPFAARVVAERCDPRDIALLRQQLLELQRLADQLESLADHEEWPELSAAATRFHKTLVELTGNSMLILTAGIITGVLGRHQRVSRFVNSDVDSPPKASAVEYKRAHRSIEKLVRMVEARDAAGAESHWREHLMQANAYWLSGRDPHAVIEIFD